MEDEVNIFTMEHLREYVQCLLSEKLLEIKEDIEHLKSRV